MRPQTLRERRRAVRPLRLERRASSPAAWCGETSRPSVMACTCATTPCAAPADQRPQVIDVRVHAAVGDQAHQVQRPAGVARTAAGRQERRVVGKRAVGTASPSRTRSCGTRGRRRWLRCPTSELPIWPSGRPTSRPDAASVVCGHRARGRRTPASPPARRRCPGRAARGPSRRGSRATPGPASALTRRRPGRSPASVGLQGGAADQPAVDVGLGEQRRRRCRASPSRRTGGGRRARRRAEQPRQQPAQVRVGRLRELRRGGAAGADRPDRLVGDGERPVPAASTSASARVSWRVSRASVSPASRSASVSPTHRISSRPAAIAAGTFSASASSVSPNSCRRSEWPSSTPVARRRPASPATPRR